MARSLPISTDTVIVGNGPAALILSYILHGNIPRYVPSPPHPDPLLHAKLSEYPDLLHLDIAHLTEHFEASEFSYSTQALPVNVLLDTLIRPNGDTCDLEKATNVTWEHRPEKAVPHMVIGNTASPGGQWVDNPVQASWEIGTLSYAGMLSLPGYSFGEHYRRTTGKDLPPFTRPSRRQVTDYLQCYPHQVCIADAIHCGETVSGITRTEDGFLIRSHGIRCKHLVLASGVFSEMIPAPPLLQPLLHLAGPSAQPASPDIPLLVIGSGFSAADVITSCPPDQKIIHIYKWSPSTSPSPLRACHQQAYPEYAGVYRRMKQAARNSLTAPNIPTRGPSRPKPRRSSTTTTSSSAFSLSRDWSTKYEGHPNTTITCVQLSNDGESALITLQRDNSDSPLFSRRISRLEYVVGRRGSLRYLAKDLRWQVHSRGDEEEHTLTGETLRDKVWADAEVAPGVFAIASLTGDSLIRFAYGSCAYAAGRIMRSDKDGRDGEVEMNDCGVKKSDLNLVSLPTAKVQVMNGLDGHHDGLGVGDLKNQIRILDVQPLDRKKDSQPA